MLPSHAPPRLVCTLLLLLLLPLSSGQEAPRLVLEAVKKGILDSLGMDGEPRPAVKAPQEELRRMFRLYQETLGEMRGNSSRSTVLLPVQPVRVLRGGGRRPILWHRAVFQSSPTSRPELTLARARLRVSWPSSGTTAGSGRRIKVYINGRKPKNSVAWTSADGQGVTLDVRPEASRWRRTRDRTLVVDVGAASGLQPAVSLELGLHGAHPAGGRRERRSAKEDRCDQRGWCCRRSMTVSFKDVGWADWVVAPAQYTMHYCDGTCPHNYKPASMHTQVKSRLHLITKGETPRPCCVPAAYEPMVLMHYDSRGKLALTTFDDLIVTKCHCA